MDQSCLDALYNCSSNNLHFFKNLKISYKKNSYNTIKLMCTRSLLVKDDANLTKDKTEWVFVNQLVNIKISNNDIIKDISLNYDIKEKTNGNLYFEYVLLEEIGNVGKFEGLSKNKYPVFWSRDFYFKLENKDYKLILK